MSSSTPDPTVGKQPRLPALRRVAPDSLPPLRLGRRDIDIVRAVWEYRALTTHQVEKLFFRPNTRDAPRAGEAVPRRKINSRCQRRLQLLFQHGYLLRDEQPVKRSEGRKPLVYFLDRRGSELLAGHGEHVDWAAGESDVQSPFLEHLLATNDVRIAVTLASEQQGYTLAKWLDDKTLKSRHVKQYVRIEADNGKSIRAAIVPDGYFRLSLPQGDAHYLLELDRGTVVGRSSHWERRDWRRKVLAYTEYIHSGMFEDRYNGRGARILTVVPSEARLRHLRDITEDAGGRRRFWFALADEVTAEAVLTEPIWRIASASGVHRLLRRVALSSDGEN